MLNKQRIPEPAALFGQKALVFKIISLKIYDHTIDIVGANVYNICICFDENEYLYIFEGIFTYI